MKLGCELGTSRILFTAEFDGIMCYIAYSVLTCLILKPSGRQMKTSVSTCASVCTCINEVQRVLDIYQHCITEKCSLYQSYVTEFFLIRICQVFLYTIYTAETAHLMRIVWVTADCNREKTREIVGKKWKGDASMKYGFTIL
jgi:hypothetical protein